MKAEFVAFDGDRGRGGRGRYGQVWREVVWWQLLIISGETTLQTTMKARHHQVSTSSKHFTSVLVGKIQPRNRFSLHFQEYAGWNDNAWILQFLVWVAECASNAVEISLKNKLRLVLCWLRENLENYQDEAITNCWNLGASFRGKGEKRVIERKLGGREEGREKKGESEQDFFLLSLLFLFLVLIRFSPTSVVNLTKFTRKSFRSFWLWKSVVPTNWFAAPTTYTAFSHRSTVAGILMKRTNEHGFIQLFFGFAS